MCWCCFGTKVNQSDCGISFTRVVDGGTGVVSLVIPVLVLIAGIVVLFNPFYAQAAVPFIILGVSSIAYGLSDLINIIRFRQKKELGCLK